MLVSESAAPLIAARPRFESIYKFVFAIIYNPRPLVDHHSGTEFAAAWHPFGAPFAADWLPFGNIADRCLVVIRGAICRRMATIRCCHWQSVGCYSAIYIAAFWSSFGNVICPGFSGIQYYLLQQFCRHSGLSLAVAWLDFADIPCRCFAIIRQCHLQFPGRHSGAAIRVVTCSCLANMLVLGNMSGSFLVAAWSPSAGVTSRCLAGIRDCQWSLPGDNF